MTTNSAIAYIKAINMVNQDQKKVR